MQKTTQYTAQIEAIKANVIADIYALATPILSAGYGDEYGDHEPFTEDEPYEIEAATSRRSGDGEGYDTIDGLYLNESGQIMCHICSYEDSNDNLQDLAIDELLGVLECIEYDILHA